MNSKSCSFVLFFHRDQLALDSDEDFSFKVEYQVGGIDYFQAQVVSWQKATAGVDTMRGATVTLDLTTSKSGGGIIKVDPDQAGVRPVPSTDRITSPRTVNQHDRADPTPRY